MKDTGKRVYSSNDHWIEVTCPTCSKSNSLKNEVLFLFGEKEHYFYCTECSFEHEEYEGSSCLILNSISNGLAKISKNPDFKGKISHFYLSKTLNKEL